mgnify:CR=1 FL=1
MGGRFSAHNALAWLGGAAGLVVLVGLKIGLLNGPLGVMILAAAVLAGGWWVLERVREHRHSSVVRQFAVQMGWNYAQHGFGVVSGLSGFPFGVGTKRRTEDVLYGNYAGLACQHATYRFDYDMGGNHSVEQVFTVTVAKLEVPLARLDLVPEDGVSRALGSVVGADIDLESAAFNRTWRLVSDDRRYAVDVVDPRMMEHLLNHVIPGVAVRVDGDSVIAWSAGRAPLETLSRRLNLVTGVANRIPAHVMRSHFDADRARREDEAARWAAAPEWATKPGVLNSRRYTGIGAEDDADGGHRHRWRKR